MTPDAINIERPDISAALAEAVGNPRVHLVWLFGQMGQGKTVALKQLLAASLPGIAAFAACSSPLGGEPTTSLKPYQPLKDIFEDLFQNRSIAKRNLKLVKNISLTVLACIPFVGDLAYGIKEIRRDLDEYKRGVRTVDFGKFEDECYATLVNIASDEPVLMIIDDVQWADRQTIQALQRFLTDEAFLARPVTIVVSCKPDDLLPAAELHALHARSTSSGVAIEVTLPPFTPAQIDEYVRMWFSRNRADALLTSWLEQKTGGNPLFLRSYLGYLQTEGVITAHGDVEGGLQNFSGLPAEVKTINAWLMKSLPDDDLQLLLTASVLGYEFSLHELVNLTQRPALELIRHLRSISTLHGVCEKIGFRQWNGKETTVYRFTQHAIHSALYNELTGEEREALHRMAAIYLSDLRRTVKEPALINSIAQPLMVHAHLGRQPDLEYDSILMNARAADGAVDTEQLRERFSALAPLIGVPVEEMEDAHRKTRAVARLASAEAAGGAPVDAAHGADGDGSAGAFTAFVADLLADLGEHKPVAVLRRTRLSLEDQRLSGMEPHPLVHLIHGIALLQRDVHDREAIEAFDAAARSTVSPIYAFIARFALALFAREADLPRLLEMLRKAAAGADTDRAPVGAMIVALLEMRTADDPALRARIMHAEEYRALLDGVRDVADAFPKTAAAMGR